MFHEVPNYTQIPNIFFDKFLTILGINELKVLLVIYRKTFGWHKKKDRISLSQLEKMTGASRTHILESVEDLIQKGLIIKTLEGDLGNQMTFYEICFKEIPTSDVESPPQSPEVTPPSDARSPTKETLTKETLTKEKREDARDFGGTKLSTPFSLFSFSKDQEGRIKKALEVKGYSEDQVDNVLEHAATDEFWNRTITSEEGFIKNFKTMLSQAPKLEKEMSVLERFQNMVKQIHKIEPLSIGHLIIDKDKEQIFESHYMRYYPVEMGVNMAYARIMGSYGK